MKVTASKSNFSWEEYRERRNKMLTASDKYVLPDYPLSNEDREAIVEYRQKLRDLFENVTAVSELQFPEWPLS